MFFDVEGPQLYLWFGGRFRKSAGKGRVICCSRKRSKQSSCSWSGPRSNNTWRIKVLYCSSSHYENMGEICWAKSDSGFKEANSARVASSAIRKARPGELWVLRKELQFQSIQAAPPRLHKGHQQSNWALRGRSNSIWTRRRTISKAGNVNSRNYWISLRSQPPA